MVEDRADGFDRTVRCLLPRKPDSSPNHVADGRRRRIPLVRRNRESPLQFPFQYSSSQEMIQFCFPLVTAPRLQEMVLTIFPLDNPPPPASFDPPLCLQRFGTNAPEVPHPSLLDFSDAPSSPAGEILSPPALPLNHGLIHPIGCGSFFPRKIYSLSVLSPIF